MRPSVFRLIETAGDPVRSDPYPRLGTARTALPRFFLHRAAFWKDALWRLNGRFEVEEAPIAAIESETRDDAFHRFPECAWMLQQVLPGMLLYAIGGWPRVVWRVLARVFVGVAGHWTGTCLTRNPGPGRWLVATAGVQSCNLPGSGLITNRVCWHNNHHAFPESARIGLDPAEFDPGWTVIRWLESRGLARNVGRPRDASERGDLRWAL